MAVPPLAERLAVTARQLRGEGVPEAQITKVFVAPPPPVAASRGVISAVGGESGPVGRERGTRTPAARARTHRHPRPKDSVLSGSRGQGRRGLKLAGLANARGSRTACLEPAAPSSGDGGK